MKTVVLPEPIKIWTISEPQPAILNLWIAIVPESIEKPPACENLKGFTVAARACLMDANVIDAGGL